MSGASSPGGGASALPAGFLSVKSRGAAGNGSSLDGPSIQAAIDEVAAAGGGTVLLPPGGYLSGSLFLRDRVCLRLEPGAVLLGSRDFRDYPLVESRWEGRTRTVHAALVHASGARDVSVTGRGSIDGRGESWWAAFREGRLEHPRPRLVAVEDCERVLLEGFSAVDSPSWTIHPSRSSDVVVRGLSIRNPPDSPNTDGINPDSCRAVRITDCFVSVGDDCITIKAGTEDELGSLVRPCEDIVVSNCVLERGHGGIVIGSEMSGGVRDVAVSNCVLKGTDRGLRIKTRRGRGGSVERVRVSNLVMADVLCPLAINMRYGCGAWGDEAVADLGARERDGLTPAVRDIALSGIHAEGARIAAAWVDGLPESPVEGLSLSDVSIRMGGDDPPAPPEMAEFVQPRSRAGFIARNASNLRLVNVRISGQRGEGFELANVSGLEAALCSPAVYTESR